jgi:hypothetical protein
VDILEEQTPIQTKKDAADSLRAIDVRVQATLGTFAPQISKEAKKEMVTHR